VNARANVQARTHANAGVSSESHGTVTAHANVHGRAGSSSSSHPNGRAFGFLAGRARGHVSGGVGNGNEGGASVHVMSHTAGAGQQGKVTICHATDSMTNPFVPIAISMNALPAHMTNHVRAAGWQNFVFAGSSCSTTTTESAQPHGNAGGQSGTGGPAGKVTICHATDSTTNPYVAITISMDALSAHMTNHVRAVGWQDFVLSSGETSCAAQAGIQPNTPGGGTPGTGTPSTPVTPAANGTAPGTTTPTSGAGVGPAGTSPSVTAPSGAVSPAESLGKTSPAVLHRKVGAPESGVAGETVAATSTKSSGSLPFTGFQALLALLVAGGILGTGVIVRKLATAKR
jgi:hypothetical protein